MQGVVPQIKQVELSFSDKYMMVVYVEKNKDSFLKIYNFKDVLNAGMSKQPVDAEITIKAPNDHEINCAKWGALDKLVYYCTDRGRLIQYDLEEKCALMVRDVHKNEIYSMEITRDFTMLFTCSKDNTCKLLHPESFDEIRNYNFDFPCRDASVSPLYDSDEN